jgi:cell division GTPase FtsZ
MRTVLIGVGQAGGKVTDALLQYEADHDANFVLDAVAVNTAKQDLQGLQRIPEDNRYLLGAARVGGHGVGADNELASEIAREERAELLSAVDDIPTSRAESFVVVAGLGGGTGSGMAPVIAGELGQLNTQPIYGLGVLPGSDEGGIYSLNAARSLRTFTRESDALLLADNDVWQGSTNSVTDAYAEINAEIARRFGLLFSAGEFDAGDQVAESVIDSSELINTLEGVSALGFASSAVSTDDDSGGGLTDRLFGGSSSSVDESESVNVVTSTIRKALRSRLSVPCETNSVGKALVVVAGPPEWLNRKGIERGRRWVEDETGCMEVRGGDYPIPGSDRVAAIVLLSGVTESRRLDALKDHAVEAKEEGDTREERLGNPDELAEDDRLDSLF